MFMLSVIRGGNFGEEASDHLDNIFDLHAADFVLRTVSS
jgi:hypothetical protein